MKYGAVREKARAIDKVKKLLALSKSNVNFFEADLAAEKAKQIIQKHKIELSELREDDYVIPRIYPKPQPRKEYSSPKPKAKSSRAYFYKGKAIPLMRYKSVHEAIEFLSQVRGDLVPFDTELTLLDLFVRLKSETLNIHSLEFRNIRNDFESTSKVVRSRYPEYGADLDLLRGLYLKIYGSRDLAKRAFIKANKIYGGESGSLNAALRELNKITFQEKEERRLAKKAIRDEFLRYFFNFRLIEGAFLLLCALTFLSIWVVILTKKI